MNVHKNARLTPKGRELLIERCARPTSGATRLTGAGAGPIRHLARLGAGE